MNRFVPFSMIMVSVLVSLPGTTAIHATSINSITTEKFILETSTGKPIDELGVNKQVSLSLTLHNNENERLAYVSIFEIRNEEGVSVKIIVSEGEISARQTSTLQAAWTPDKIGSYEIRQFLLSDIAVPEILSTVTSKSVDVGEKEIISAEAIPSPADPVDEPETLDNSPDKYTIMIYMVASDLESRNYAATSDISEMLDAEIDPHVNVIIQTGGSANSTIDDTRLIDFTKAQRFEIKDNQANLRMDLGLRNMGDPDTLESFLGWAEASYPAEKYILIMWDHGNGIRGFGYDDIYGDSLTILEIKEALQESNKHLELIGFDGCLMATVEVASQLVFRASYLVASQEVEPEWGWDYKTILSSFVFPEDGSIDGKHIGIVIADSYIEHSKSKASLEKFEVDRYVTLSVVDLTKVKDLSSDIKDMADDLRRFVTNLDGAYTFSKMVRYTERYGTDYYSTSGYADLYQMADNADMLFPSLSGMGNVIKSSLNEAVIYNVNGEARSNAHGLSIFLQLDPTESGQEYLTYLVPEWLQAIEAKDRTLATDKKAPSGVLEYSSGKIEGTIKGDDVAYGTISFFTEIEDSSKYQVISHSALDPTEFLDDGGEVEYELNDLISLCNEDKCIPVFFLLEDYEDSTFAYLPVRLVSEDDEYDEYVNLIYEVKNNDFIFIGAWEGFQDETAQRGLRALNDGDKIFAIMYEYDDEDRDYFQEIESEPIEVTDGFGPEYKSLEGEHTFQMSICDYAQNCFHSEIFEIE